jgi:hypothetical protein
MACKNHVQKVILRAQEGKRKVHIKACRNQQKACILFHQRTILMYIHTHYCGYIYIYIDISLSFHVLNIRIPD